MGDLLGSLVWESQKWTILCHWGGSLQCRPTASTWASNVTTCPNLHRRGDGMAEVVDCSEL